MDETRFNNIADASLAQGLRLVLKGATLEQTGRMTPEIRSSAVNHFRKGSTDSHFEGLGPKDHITQGFWVVLNLTRVEVHRLLTSSDLQASNVGHAEAGKSAVPSPVCRSGESPDAVDGGAPPLVPGSSVH